VVADFTVTFSIAYCYAVVTDNADARRYSIVL